MSIYKLPDISGGFSDFWAYIRADRPHRWPALGLAVTVAGLLIYVIARSVAPPEPPKQVIIYAESWPADRSDFDVRRDWLNRALLANDRNQQRRNNYGAVAKMLGQDYDQAAADREFDEARAVIRQALRDLEAAQAAGRPLPPLPRRDPAAPGAQAAERRAASPAGQ